MKKRKRWEIVFEDDAIVVVDKPAKYLTIPDRYDQTIPSLLGSLSQQREEVYVNHRLDKDTSGLIVFTKTEQAHKALSLAFENRELDKHYLAIVSSIPPIEVGLIDLAISKSKGRKKGMIIDAEGKPSQTKYRIVESWRQHSYLEIKLLTGRQHQIRVHLQSMGCPILCDSLYGDGQPFLLSSIKRKMNRNIEVEERPLLSRVALHSHLLAFAHPVTGERVEFSSKLPKDMNAVVNQLTKWG